MDLDAHPQRADALLDTGANTRTDTRADAHADSVAKRRAQVRQLGLICAVLMLATIALSAFLRLSASGLGCADWPACYGQALRDAAASSVPATATSPGVTLARLAHRIVASMVLVLALTALLWTHFPRPTLQRESRLALALLLMALALAVLGVATPGATVPAVAVGNLLGGFVMLALSWRLAAPMDDPSNDPSNDPTNDPTYDLTNDPTNKPTNDLPTFQIRRWARLGLLLLLLQIGLGALVSGSYAALACSDWADCSRTALAAGWDWQALNLWQPLRPDAAAPGHGQGAWLQLLHRGGTLLLVPLLAWVGLLALRQGRRRVALRLGLLLALQLLIGLLTPATGLPLSAVLMHNIAAALLLALLARLA